MTSQANEGGGGGVWTTAPLSRDDFADHLLRAAEYVLADDALAHHLAKASIERWFAFEIARHLDGLLAGAGLVSLVERGSTTGVGNFDVLVVPRTKAARALRLGTPTPWAEGTLAVEIKCAHLGDGNTAKGTYSSALLSDLVDKPGLAAAAGRRCEILGLLIATDGTWGAATHAAARSLGDKLAAGDLPLAEGLVRLQSRLLERSLVYSVCGGEGQTTWEGRVWVEVIGAARST